MHRQNFFRKGWRKYGFFILAILACAVNLVLLKFMSENKDMLRTRIEEVKFAGAMISLMIEYCYASDDYNSDTAAENRARSGTSHVLNPTIMTDHPC